MKSKYTAIISHSDDWWIGWVMEIPGVNCQERTKEELLVTLRVTLSEALEWNRNDALAVAGKDFEIAEIPA